MIQSKEPKIQGSLTAPGPQPMARKPMAGPGAGPRVKGPLEPQPGVAMENLYLPNGKSMNIHHLGTLLFDTLW